MSGPDPNTNLSPVVSQPQGGAPQGPAPAYIAPPEPGYAGFGGNADLGGFLRGVGSKIASIYNVDPTTGRAPGAPPPTATDAVASPQPGSQAGQQSAAGTPMSTFNTGEQHPQTHSLEDFVNANRHLTLHDITKLMPGILPGMDPHRQMVSEAYAGLVSQRDAAFKQAMVLENGGKVAEANALRQHAAAEHMKNLMPLIASNNPYAAMGAAQSYGTTP